MTLYRTSDIYFSSYLCALDVPLLTTEGTKDKIVFVFKMSHADINRMKASYFGGTGTVKARRFVDNLRNLKSMCYTLLLFSLIPLVLL